MHNRTFTQDDQQAFASLSGDNNDLHLNAVAARRSLFGSPVVHGVNALLWALDTCLQSRTDPYEISKLKVLFTRQIKVGEEVHIVPGKADATSLKLKIVAQDTPVATVKVELRQQSSADKACLIDGLPEQVPPVDLADDEFSSARGELELFLDRALLQRLYPALAASLNPLHLAIILGSTRIVGVHCPGKYSLFSELELTAVSDNGLRLLGYEVEGIDERFGLVEMNLNAPAMSGVVRAFRRPAPQKQADFTDLRNLVSSNEFAAQRAVIVGGSRGLGEVAAKLLAAGGADIKISYHQGHEEAGQLVNEIVVNGGVADSFQFDVLNPEITAESVSRDGWLPTHLYYFATPFISPGINGQFSFQLFRHFCDYYVTGFEKTVAALWADKPLKIFSPSSVMIDEPPPNLQEYVAAKISGETVAAFLQRAYPGVAVYAPRLPRMATDQTANVAAVQSDDPVPVMLAALRAFQAVEH